MDERKNIILSLKSSIGESPKGIKSRIKFLKITIIINLLATIVFAGILTLSIVSELFNYEVISWGKAGLAVIMSFTFSISLSKQIFEFKLLKHLIKISTKSDFVGITRLNEELKKIIYQRNNTLRTRWFLTLLIVFILIMGLSQILFENNPYWNFMKIPFLLTYGILLTDFIITNRKLTKNIKETERRCN